MSTKRGGEGQSHYHNKVRKSEEIMDEVLEHEPDDDEEDEEEEGVLTIEGIEIEASVKRVRNLLKVKYDDELDDFDFYLQDNKLENHRSIIEQCNLVEGAKQQTKLINIKLIIDPELKRVNILDILKPPENVKNVHVVPPQSQTPKQIMQPKRLIGGLKNSNFSEHVLPSPGNRTGNNGQIQLWQFLLELLTDADAREWIQWIGVDGN